MGLAIFARTDIGVLEHYQSEEPANLHMAHVDKEGPTPYQLALIIELCTGGLGPNWIWLSYRSA